MQRRIKGRKGVGISLKAQKHHSIASCSVAGECAGRFAAGTITATACSTTVTSLSVSSPERTGIRPRRWFFRFRDHLRIGQDGLDVVHDDRGA
jgi:hypothetical protein